MLCKAELAEVGSPARCLDLIRGAAWSEKAAKDLDRSCSAETTAVVVYIPIKAVRRASEWGKGRPLSCE